MMPAIRNLTRLKSLKKKRLQRKLLPKILLKILQRLLLKILPQKQTKKKYLTRQSPQNQKTKRFLPEKLQLLTNLRMLLRTAATAVTTALMSNGHLKTEF